MRTLLARRWIDGLVVALAVVAQVEVWTASAQTPRPVAALAALLWTLPLLARRRFPLGAPAVVFATLAVETLLSGAVVASSGVNPFALFAAFWIVGAHSDQRAALTGGAIGYAAMAVIVLIDDPPAGSVVVIFVLAAAAWAIGRALSDRTRRTEELELRAERLEREQQASALRHAASNGGGHGISGMRQRVALYGDVPELDQRRARVHALRRPLVRQAPLDRRAELAPVPERARRHRWRRRRRSRPRHVPAGAR
ncbi:MAG TPA: hypothetical protein VG474_01350 [Solirubrobacteraceae bacterium]|nr:hypothetical protein [Solirubrobacteraceae bacterium]